MYRVGIDIGGTFTDMLLVGDDGNAVIGKTLTTPGDPSLAVEDALRPVLESGAVKTGDRGTLIHGTTLVTNALIERKGAPTALLTTAGFRDAVEIGREHRYELYDLNLDLPRPLVPRHLRFDVPERMAADGEPTEIYDYLKLLAGTGKVRLYGCRFAAATFEVKESDLVPEAEGIVERTVIPEMPVRIEYHLTDKGKSLESVLASVSQWAETWVDAPTAEAQCDEVTRTG